MEGNQMKMREALEYANNELLRATEDDRYGDDVVYLVGCMRTVATVCRAAIAKPPRNCDVGSEEEQSRRYEVFCEAHHMQCDKVCSACPCSKKSGVSCELYWAQMSYGAEEGGAK